MLVYPFRVTRNAIKNRPADEVRGQLRYGSEESWTRTHPVGRDIAGVDVSMILGIDLDSGSVVGLDANLWDPLPMGISFYAKDAELEHAKHRVARLGEGQPRWHARTGQFADPAGDGRRFHARSSDRLRPPRTTLDLASTGSRPCGSRRPHVAMPQRQGVDESARATCSRSSSRSPASRSSTSSAAATASPSPSVAGSPSTTTRAAAASSGQLQSCAGSTSTRCTISTSRSRRPRSPGRVQEREPEHG